MLPVNYIILAMVTGAIFLAAVYHSVLFIHNRLRLIGYYSMYLWGAFAYCLLRCVYYTYLPDVAAIVPDECVQMISFALYIRFTKTAMELNPATDRLATWFCTMAPYVIGIYIGLNTLFNYLHYTHHTGPLPYYLVYLTIRIFLLAVGFTGLVAVIRKRHDVYFRYIFFAILAVILTGFIATFVEIFFKPVSPISALTILVLGFLIDVCFFSAAISYKMRMETLQKESANRRVLEQELEIQKTNTELLVLSFKVKEEERSRIATELHDEIGSTLSSISILSGVILKERNTTSVRTMQQEIMSSSKVIMEKMDDIIFSLNPRNDSMEKMLLRIRQFATPLFEAKNIDYAFDFDKTIYHLPIPIEQRQQIYLILKEAINNLVKHAGCSTATVSAQQTPAAIIFTIADNGKGFDTDADFTGNGLLNMKTRAVRMGADITFQTIAGINTAITLTLKIG